MPPKSSQSSPSASEGRGRDGVLSLTDRQFEQVMTAASLIAPPLRDDFLRHLAAQLGDEHKPSDARLTFVICETLAQRGVAVGRQFFRGGHHGDTAQCG
jgi:hypothetical protein